ncbi:hypothetical protein WICMUC_003669 [Wickerhamomyces mucosus]|uniref:Calcineurin-like phosphoesterase domain-containing protein n=1 Tax=Wickerhamomyces mucosus TaxID=1378264 RepID=A0A9P8PK38_9ASCO|nr:hypothetical protein WICMUC_003669 [Wickerhamomyces mucosus]
MLLPLLEIAQLALAIPVELADLLDDNAWPVNGKSPTDKQIIDQTLHTLKTLYSTNSTNVDNCIRCKTTLDVGKSIALTRPDLVPEIFVKWCTDNKIASASTCKTTYSRNSITASRTGIDFTNMLQLIDPWAIDGDYLCYYKLGECSLPETPEVDLSSWWPAKNESNASIEYGHDTFPYGQLASHASGHENLYSWNDELFADLWVGYDWLPFEDYEEVKKHYTGYSVTTKSGIKVIAVNSNSYYQKNYYSYWNMTENVDTFGTLKFIVDELIESEAKNEKVWIIAHIPFVDYDALPIQAEAYKQILTRFAPTTITGLFFGHTHQDQFNVLYANDNKTIDNAILNTWIDLSVTPQQDYNPGWRYYEVDKKSKTIMNSYNYYLRLNETFTNHTEPEWLFEYSARDSYDVNGEWPKEAPLNATFWATVAEKMKTEKNITQLYSDFSYRLSPYVPSCDEGDCEDMYCYVSSFSHEQYVNCTASSKIDYE